MKISFVLSCIGLLLCVQTSYAQQTSQWGNLQTRGDQGDGTYNNPILPGDFQNTDVIRVGNTYYYISATKELSPGMLIMSSKDLVNWKYTAHAVNDITQINKRYNYDVMEGTSRGIWAGAIRYYNHKFFIYFTDPDEGIYMTTADKPESPWQPLTCLLKAPGWDDPCPFWDDDGQAYLVTTNFSDKYKIHLFKMSSDGKQLMMESDSVIHQSRGSEANKLYRINNYYYHFYSEVTSTGRMPFMKRSKNIYGPYEGGRQLIHKAEGEPNQGGMIQTVNGAWYFITHHGKAYWDGREVSLLPVTWADGWPLWGAADNDSIGNMVWKNKKPVINKNAPSIESSDEFNGNILSPQWEWYFQPRGDKWSLKERPGFLRLYACKPLQANAIKKTTNVLTQRPLRIDKSTITIKIDISHMVNGQSAGLCLFGKTTGGIVVQHKNNKHYFYEWGINSGSAEAIADLDIVWLRSTWNISGTATFSYSVDGKKFVQSGKPYQVINFGNFLGAKIGIYTASETEEKGFIDIDWFHYDRIP